MIYSQLNSILGKVEDAIVIGIIAIFIIICVVIMLKYEQSRKALLYVIGAVVILFGVFSGISLNKELRAKSYVRGSLDNLNITSQETFAYVTNSVVFYKNNDGTYETSINLIKVENFDGQEKDYRVFLNGYELLNADIGAGYVTATITLDFFNTQGEVICESMMNIKIEFYSDKTTLTLSTENSTQAQFLEAYFKNNGLNIKITEAKSGSKENLNNSI